MKHILLILTILFLPLQAGATTVLASYLSNNNNGESIYRDTGPTTYQAVCQPFTVTTSGTYSVGMLANLKKTGTPSVDLNFKIHDNTGGANCGTQLGSVLGSNTVAGSSVGTSFGMIAATTTASVTFETAHTYFFVINTDTDGTDDLNYFNWSMANISIPYSSEYYKTNGTWAAETGWNVTFQINGDVPAATATPTSILSLVRSFWIL